MAKCGKRGKAGRKKAFLGCIFVHGGKRKKEGPTIGIKRT